MTLNIHTEENDQRQLKMTVEVAEERVHQAMREAARQIARDITVPGFRKGKVPYHVLVKRVGREALRAEAIEDIIPAIFEEALEQVAPELYGQPSLDNLESEPLVLKFTVPLTPDVKLGDYRSLRQDIEPVVVTEEAVDEALEQVRIRHQVLEPVDRPIQEGDVVTLSGKGWLPAPEEAAVPAGELSSSGTAEAEAAGDGGSIIFEEERVDLLMDGDKLFAGTPFVENLIGLAAGDPTSFTFVFPEEYEDQELAGREAAFDLTILEVKNRQMPELDDELAKEEGGHETVAELRETVRENLQKQAEAQAHNDILESTMDELLAGATLVYPPTTVELQIDSLIETYKNQVSRSNWQWPDFLRMQGQTEEALREELRPAAVEHLEQQLVLQQFVLDEKLAVGPAEIDAAIAERVGRFADNEELQKGMGDFYRSGRGFNTLSGEILTDKVVERMKAILTGNAPDLEALPTEIVDEEEEEE